MNKILENVTIDVMAHVLRCQAEGWTDELIDGYANGELSKAAACFALGDSNVAIPIGPNTTIHHNIYPWDASHFERKPERRQDLIEAIGYLMEEVARLDRIDARAKAEAEAAEKARREAEEEARRVAELSEPLPSIFQSQVPIKGGTELPIKIPVSMPDSLREALAEVNHAISNIPVTPPPKPTLGAKIINFKDAFKKVSAVRMHTMRQGLYSAFGFL